MPTAPPGGFQQGKWYEGRQYWDGTFSEPGQINPLSNQVGAGQMVSAEVNAQSAAAQGVSPQQLESYLQQQRQAGGGAAPSSYVPGGTPGGAGASTGAAGAGFTPPETINLPDIYQNLYSESGIKDLEAKYSQMEKEYIDAKGKINDNPFLSEATRVGRVAKIEQLFNERTANIKGDIATKKADIETQLNLQTKQFDINSQAAQQALNQFNTLLQLGALDNASGETIAQLTMSTGIPSDAIYSAINANKAKNVQTQLIQSTGENGEVTVSVVNANTGELIKQTSLGIIGNVQTGPKPTETEKASYYKSSLIEDVSNYTGLMDVLKIYSQYLDPQDIYQIYNINSPYGPAYETQDELQKYGIKIE